MTLLERAFSKRRLANRLISPSASLLRAEQLGAILQRERARSDRTGEVFSLIVFEVGKQMDDQETLENLAAILQGRLRLTDDAGLLGPRHDWRRVAGYACIRSMDCC